MSKEYNSTKRFDRQSIRNRISYLLKRNSAYLWIWDSVIGSTVHFGNSFAYFAVLWWSDRTCTMRFRLFLERGRSSCSFLPSWSFNFPSIRNQLLETARASTILSSLWFWNSYSLNNIIEIFFLLLFKTNKIAYISKNC